VRGRFAVVTVLAVVVAFSLPGGVAIAASCTLPTASPSSPNVGDVVTFSGGSCPNAMREFSWVFSGLQVWQLRMSGTLSVAQAENALRTSIYCDVPGSVVVFSEDNANALFRQVLVTCASASGVKASDPVRVTDIPAVIVTGGGATPVDVKVASGGATQPVSVVGPDPLPVSGVASGTITFPEGFESAVAWGLGLLVFLLTIRVIHGWAVARRGEAG
jgi:hypothetical protein